MNILTREELRSMMEGHSEVCVSIYLPTERSDHQEGQIRLKNLLREAAKQLEASGQKVTQIAQMLRKSTALLGDAPFWQGAADGLAIFITPEDTKFWRLPIKFDEQVVVGPHLHIKPLLPLFSEDGQFFVLALSMNKVRLLHCTHHTQREVQTDGIPSSLEETLQYDAKDKGSHPHTHAMEMDSKENLLRYFQEVNKGLMAMLAGQHGHLVVACVDYLFPIFREACSYHNLYEKPIIGSPDALKNEELHKKAWAHIAQHFQEHRQKSHDDLRQLLGSEHASKETAQILTAAIGGRVQVLFASKGKEQWGRFDYNTGTIEIHDRLEPGSEDLVNLAAIHASLTGATVYTVDAEHAPISAPVSAMFRY